MIIIYLSHEDNRVSIDLSIKTITYWSEEKGHLRIRWKGVRKNPLTLPVSGVYIPTEKIKNKAEVLDYLKNNY